MAGIRKRRCVVRSRAEWEGGGGGGQGGDQAGSPGVPCYRGQAGHRDVILVIIPSIISFVPRK